MSETGQSVAVDADRVPSAYAGIARAIAQPQPRLGEAHVDAWFGRPAHRLLAFGVQTKRAHEDFVFRFAQNWSVLELGERFPASPAALLHLRHAFEWRALACAAHAGTDRATLGSIGLATACLFVGGEPRSVTDSVRAALPAALREVLDATANADVLADPASCRALAVALTAAGDDSQEDAGTLASALERVGALVLPVEVLLTLGGDGRLRLDRELRLNKYGCSPMPRPEAVTFASCTATSVSDLAFHRADTVRRELILRALEQGAVETAHEHAGGLRQRISREFGLTDEHVLALAPSGTDCELLLTSLALALGHAPVQHVAVGFDEAGSGTSSAARGMHFDVLTPRGARVPKDAPLEGMDSSDVTLTDVGLRGPEGAPHTLSQIDAAVEEVVTQALANGRQVVLHAMDNSKTGLGGPSLELARRLRERAGERVWVVVDAAQMRVSRDTLARYLNADCMVVLTGSKFFTGPPFAGAVAIPAALAHRFDAVDSLPAGLGEYFSKPDLPPRWQRWMDAKSMRCNLGLLLRWEAALAEVEAFHAVPAAARRAYFEQFRDGVLALFQAFPALEPVVSDSFHETVRNVTDGWDCVQTIFPFLCRRGGDVRATPFDMEQALRLYHFLNSDLRAHLHGRVADHALDLAARQCHIGQPVGIALPGGRIAGALRIAPGSRFAARVHFDPLLGPNPAERLARQLDDARTVMRKAQLILEHWDVLPDMKPKPALDADLRAEALA